MTDNLHRATRLPVHTHEICLYGIERTGYAYLLATQSGIVATSGPASYHHADFDAVQKAPTMADAVKHALKFVPENAIVRVLNPDAEQVSIGRADWLLETFETIGAVLT